MRGLFYVLAVVTSSLIIAIVLFPSSLLITTRYRAHEYLREVTEAERIIDKNATEHHAHELSNSTKNGSSDEAISGNSANSTLGKSSGTNATSNVSEKGLFGVRKRGKSYLLVYNNVPKCGSRSLAYSIGDTLKRNGNYRGIKVQGNKRDRGDLTRSFRRVKTPAYISGHMPLAIPQRSDIIYINMVRDPIERFVSMYYFYLYGDEGGLRPEVERKRPPQNQSIDEYIANGAAVDSNIYFHFDSQDSDRFSGSVLERAKTNIDRYFIIVGLTEELTTTIKLLGKLLPDLLHGIDRIYKHRISERRQTFSTKNKIPPSNRTIAILREKLSAEYELYNFVRQRFAQLKKKYGVT